MVEREYKASFPRFKLRMNKIWDACVSYGLIITRGAGREDETT